VTADDRSVDTRDDQMMQRVSAAMY